MYRKKFLKVSTAFFLIVGAFLLFGPKHWFPSLYYPLYFGIIALISPLLVYLPSFAIARETPRKTDLMLNLQVIICFSLLINLSGQLGLYQLYKIGFEYDKFAHFLVCMLFAFILEEILKEWFHISFIKRFLIVVLALLFSGFVWEIFEVVSDFFFGTQEWGVNGMYGITDTLKDIGFNLLGIFFGILVSSIPKKMKKKEA